jgi:hypothetical protein
MCDGYEDLVGILSTARASTRASTIQSDDSVARVDTSPLPEQDAQRKADPPTMLSNDSRPPLRCPPADSDSDATHGHAI